MALNADLQILIQPGSTGNQTYSLSSNFDPKAVILWGVPQATGTVGTGWSFCVGFGTYRGGVVQQRHSAMRQLDGATSADLAFSHGSGSLFVHQTNSAGSSTLDLEIDLVSMQTGATSEVVLNWVNLHSTASVRVMMLVLGGSDIQDALVSDGTFPTGTNTKDFTVVSGFGKPELLFVTGAHGTSFAASAATPKFIFGFGKQGEAGRGFGFSEVDGNTAALTGMAQRSDRIVNSILATGASASTNEALGALDTTVSNWPTDGFRMLFSANPAAATIFSYLALRTTAQITTGSGLAPDTGTPPVVQNLDAGFAPKLGFLFGWNDTNREATESARSFQVGFGIGAYDGSTEGHAGFVEDDGAGTMVSKQHWSTSKVIQNFVSNAPSGPVSEADGSFSGNNFVLSWDDIDEDLQRQYQWLALGDAAAFNPTGTSSASGAGLTTAAAQKGTTSISSGSSAGSTSSSVVSNRLNASSSQGSGSVSTSSNKSPQHSGSCSGSGACQGSGYKNGSSNSSSSESGLISGTGFKSANNSGSVSGSGQIVSTPTSYSADGDSAVSAEGQITSQGIKNAITTSSVTGGIQDLRVREYDEGEYDECQYDGCLVDHSVGHKGGVSSSSSSGSGSANGSGAAGQQEVSVVSGAGFIQSSATKQAFSSSSVSGSGNIESTPEEASAEDDSDVSGSGIANTSGFKSAFSSSSIAGAGTAQTQGQVTASGSSTVSGSGMRMLIPREYDEGEYDEGLYDGFEVENSVGFKGGLSSSTATGSGGASGQGEPDFTAASQVSGSGNINTSAFKNAQSASSVSGSGNVSTDVEEGIEEQTEVSGAGNADSAGFKSATSSSVISGNGSVNSQTNKSAQSTTDASGAGSVSSTVAPGEQQASTVSGSGLVSSVGFKSASGSSSVSADANASSQAIKSASSSTDISGGGSVSTTVAPGEQQASTVSGAGTVSSSGNKNAVSVSSVSGAGSVSSTTSPQDQQQTQVSGAGSVHNSGFKSAYSATSVSGSGQAETTIEDEEQTASEVSGSGEVSSTGDKAAYSSSSVSDGGSVTSQGIKNASAISSVSGSGNVETRTEQTADGSSNVSESGVVATTSHKNAYSSSSVSGSGNVESEDSSANQDSSNVSGAGTVQTTSNKNAYSASQVSGAGSIASISGATEEEQSNVSGDPQITTTGLKNAYSTSSVSGSGTVITENRLSEVIEVLGTSVQEIEEAIQEDIDQEPPPTGTGGEQLFQRQTGVQNIIEVPTGIEPEPVPPSYSAGDGGVYAGGPLVPIERPQKTEREDVYSVATNHQFIGEEIHKTIVVEKEVFVEQQPELEDTSSDSMIVEIDAEATENKNLQEDAIAPNIPVESNGYGNIEQEVQRRVMLERKRLEDMFILTLLTKRKKS